MLKVGLKLFVITLIAAAALGAVNYITAPITKENEKAAREKAMAEVVGIDSVGFSEENITSDETHKETGVTSYYIATNEETNRLEGYAVFVTVKGDQGDISVCVGIGGDGVVRGVRMVSHNETPGLGAEAAKPEFLSQYEGKAGVFTVVKGESGDPLEIDTVTAATHTSDAVTKAVNAAFTFYSDFLKSEVTNP